jgi:cobalt-zinc-cadmium efflux system outer membrane protein
LGLFVLLVPAHSLPQGSIFVERPPANFRDAVAGVSISDLIRRALDTNADLAASRLEVQRARGRLQQAGLAPNPALNAEQTVGRLSGSPGENQFSVGVTVPIELGEKRARRVDVARTDLAAANAQVEERERLLAAAVREAFASVLGALRNLEVISELNDLDRQIVQFVEIRVKEGESAPLELSLLRADAERLRSRRALTQGRLEAAILRLKNLCGIPINDNLRVREDLMTLAIAPPSALEPALKDALTRRPDLRLARLNEELAEAGLRLARAQGIPNLLLYTRFSTGTMLFDDTPVGILQDSDNLLTFGMSIDLPVRNRNQGAKLEAQAEILQATERRKFLESLVNAEVRSAYARYEAAQAAVTIYATDVIDRSTQNVNAVRGAYEIGSFRITELLTERRRAVDFQTEYTEVLAERYRARADLDAALAVPIP